MSDEETLAWHEAGHAVVASLLHSEIKSVSLDPAIVVERPTRKHCRRCAPRAAP
jgi:hypothetical protein